MTKLQKQIYQRLIYSSVFNWPLKKSEISAGQKTLKNLIKKKKITKKAGYYFVFGQKKYISLRKKREKIAQKKLAKAQKLAKLLKHFFWIKLIAVTGNVAVGNTQTKDDIDIFIVTAEKRLWLVRPIVVFLLELLGWRRRPGDQQAEDKFCLNLWLDKANLNLPLAKQNFYTAREIKQMKILLDKDKTYKKFIKKNSWLKKF